MCKLHLMDMYKLMDVESQGQPVSCTIQNSGHGLVLKWTTR